MRKSIALAGLVLVGFMGVAAAAPCADVGLPVSAITTTSSAEAAIGRGGGGSEGGNPGVLKRLGNLIQGEISAAFFIVVAVVLGVTIFGQRNAAAAVALVLASFVIGAFLLVPDQVESLFRSIYGYVL